MENTVNMNKFEGVKTDIELEEFVGEWLPNDIHARFHTMDGSCVAAYLTMIGYKVVSNKDTGHSGIAITKDGYRVSTNGYVCKVVLKAFDIYTVSSKYTLKECVDETHARKKLFDAHGITDDVIFKVEEKI